MNLLAASVGMNISGLMDKQQVRQMKAKKDLGRIKVSFLSGFDQGFDFADND